MLAMEGAVIGAWAWWLGLLFGAVPLLCLAVWHSTDAWHCAAFALKYVGRGSNGIRRRLPPGHMGVPFLGEMLSLLWYFKLTRRPDDFIRAKKTAYGNEQAGMYRSHLFGSPTIIACSPAANKFVLQSAESFGIKWPVPELIGITSLSNVEGDSHTRLRGFILAAINRPSSLQTIATVVQPRDVAALRAWADKGTIVAAKEIKKSRRKLDAVFREELEARKKMDKKCDDLMSGLMQMKDAQGKKLTDEEVVHNIVSLVIGGYASTTIAIMWAVYHLAKSPIILAKLREENVAMSKRKGGSKSKSLMITHDDIPKMKYTAKVVEETIRMANISPIVHRVANMDVEYRGYTIPKGWAVLVWLRSLHTDPNYYEDPLSFNPDRWDVASCAVQAYISGDRLVPMAMDGGWRCHLTGKPRLDAPACALVATTLPFRSDQEPAKPGTYQVFGGGPRICASNMLARLQVTIILHHLCIGYEWELLNPDAEINYLPHPRSADGAAMAFRKLST